MGATLRLITVQRHAATIGLVVLTTASAALRFLAARGMDVPWNPGDETIYALLGRAFWENDPSVLGTSTGGYSLVYPALIGLPLSLGDVETGLVGAQAIGAIVMSSTAVVVYLWGRPLVGAWWALGAAALAVALPELAYSGLLMSEVAIYPTATLALWAIAAALARPSPVRQALVAAAILLALATHVRSLALVPALFVAVALHCAFTRSLVPARRLAPLLAAVAAACLVTVSAFAIAGSSEDVLGVYAAAAGGYELAAAAKDIFWHLGGVFILVAGIPLVALGAMTVECARRRERDPQACALVATTVAWTTCLVLEVGTFASRWVGHVVLRDLLPVVPPLLLVFALWLVRGLPRPIPAVQLIAFAVAVPAALFPLKRFATQEAALDSFSLIPLWRLLETRSDATVELAYVLAAAGLVAAAILVPLRFRLVLPALVAVALVAQTIVSTREIDRLTAADRAWVFDVGDPQWVDRAADGPVTYLQAATALSATFWKHAFWNRRIDAVARLPDAAPVGPAQATAVTLPDSGVLRTPAGTPLETRLVVSPKQIELVGERIAEAPRSTDLPGLTLWRVPGSVKVSTWSSGLQPNGDILGEALMTVYACGPGRLELILLGKQGLPVEIRADGILYKRVTVPPGEVWQGAVRTPPDADGKRSCLYEVTSPGLVGSTRFEFVRGG